MKGKQAVEEKDTRVVESNKELRTKLDTDQELNDDNVESPKGSGILKISTPQSSSDIFIPDKAYIKMLENLSLEMVRSTVICFSLFHC